MFGVSTAKWASVRPYQRAKPTITRKLKGNREFSWYGVNGISAGVQETENAKESVANLINGMWHSAVIYFECFRSRTLWVTLRFSMVKMCAIVVYWPTERDGEEKERL